VVRAEVRGLGDAAVGDGWITPGPHRQPRAWRSSCRQGRRQHSGAISLARIKGAKPYTEEDVSVASRSPPGRP